MKVIRFEFQCHVWNNHWPIQCRKHFGHVGIHSSVDDSQFKYVREFESVTEFQWENDLDVQLLEIHVSTIRTDAYNNFLDLVDAQMKTPREIIAFCEAMQAFAPLT